jgi:hypothetical protein
MSDGSLGMDFDEYVSLSRQTMQDVGNLYAGIDYLRFIDGEKHLVFLTEQGFLLPSADFDRDVAAMAADARVAIDTIQTGGVHTVLVKGFPEIPPQTSFALSALRTVAEISGGQASINSRAEAGFDRILNATGFGYLLGYVAPSSRVDGRFRRIEVSVARRGVTVSYRRGYFARLEPESFDPRRSLATTRIVTAAGYQGDVNDLRLSFTVNDVRENGLRHARITGTVSADRVVFATGLGPTGPRHLAALNLAAFCTDEQGRSVGEHWKTLDIPIPSELFEEIRRTGLAFSMDVAVTTRPTFVRLVVYDYGSDLLGAKTTRVR